MPLSQTIYRKQCLLHFELRGCIVSKKKEKSPHMLETCWQWRLVLLSPHLNLEAFILNVECFHLWPSAQKAQQNLFGKPGSWEAAVLKSILGEERPERGLTLEQLVQILLRPALCEMINCCHLAMCNHHRCQGLQNLRTSRTNSRDCRSASQQHVLSSRIPFHSFSLLCVTPLGLDQFTTAEGWSPRMTCPHACLTYSSSCCRLPRTRSQPSSNPHGKFLCKSFYAYWVRLYTFVCVRCKYLHSKALHECAQCCTWVMVPVLQSSEGPVSALEKPDSSITLRNWWMPGLVGFLLWAIIQVRGRSGFSKGSWLLTPPETGGLRPWEKKWTLFPEAHVFIIHCRGDCHNETTSLKYFHSRSPPHIADWELRDLFMNLIVLLLW